MSQSAVQADLPLLVVENPTVFRSEVEFWYSRSGDAVCWYSRLNKVVCFAYGRERNREGVEKRKNWCAGV